MYEVRREVQKMENYKQAAELAIMCAYNAQLDEPARSCRALADGQGVPGKGREVGLQAD
jgi:hypothetical protein